MNTCNYRFANTYLWERITTSRYINCQRLFHSEKKVCYMVYTSLVLFFLVTFGDIVVIDPIVSLLRYYCRWEVGIWDLLRSLNLCHPKTPWTSLLITLSGRFYVNSPVHIAVTANPLLQVLTCINYSVTCVHFRFYLYLFTSTMSHMDIFAWMYMYIWVQHHTSFVFTALADECSVGRISEGCFVRDETCSHPNNVFYATTSVALQLAYVYTMEVVKLEKNVLVWICPWPWFLNTQH